MRHLKATLATLTCALVLVPAGVATAGSGAPSGPSARATTPSTAGTPAGNPNSARAEAAGVCADAYQIGATGYVVRNGVKIGSVKQFYSPQCQENYGYLWVWDGFHDTGAVYDASVGVFSYKKDTVLGGRNWWDTTQQEFWSYGTDTVNECTSAVARIRKVGDPVDEEAASAKRC
ncbi:hypothetical protein AQ490_25925 [Wenjunlia vitaminophila]|uniref:Secreted protein n=1 Tax=Wenjunlia vitaminophila TaxID=76728 RepID=A0A0T6LQC9_WENVI|nr:hypothetical protein [Wenjunlia vitaminophila]KRV48240.1 hypothetical protein AQ490_25925 [Wenjunlia vitaminophila]